MPDIQILVVTSIIAIAAAYVAWQNLREWRGKGKGCGGSCRCDAKPPIPESRQLIPLQQVATETRSN